MSVCASGIRDNNRSVSVSDTMIELSYDEVINWEPSWDLTMLEKTNNHEFISLTKILISRNFEKIIKMNLFF